MRIDWGYFFTSQNGKIGEILHVLATLLMTSIRIDVVIHKIDKGLWQILVITDRAIRSPSDVIRITLKLKWCVLMIIRVIFLRMRRRLSGHNARLSHGRHAFDSRPAQQISNHTTLKAGSRQITMVKWIGGADLMVVRPVIQHQKNRTASKNQTKTWKGRGKE